MKTRFMVVLSALLACIWLTAVPDAGCGETLQPNEPSEWTSPDCDRVTGTNAVTFTRDEGLSLAEYSVLRQPFYTNGLAALDVPNTIVAASWMDSTAALLRSEDAGCQWRKMADLRDCSRLSFVAGPGGIVYGWTSGRSQLYRIDGKEVTALVAPDVVYGMAVDPADAMHLRIGGSLCQIYESLDGGATFTPVGNPAPLSISAVFAVDFQPLDLDLVLCGSKGAWRTTDGGESWRTVSPFSYENDDAVYLFEYSQVDWRRVWARARLGDGPKGIFVSEDGGASFSLAAAEGTIVPDQNGIARKLILANYPTVAAHPRNPDVVYFVSSTSFDNYGTDLYRYELTTDYLSVTHIDNLDGIDAFAFNPADPSVMYLGLKQEIISLNE